MTAPRFTIGEACELLYPPIEPERLAAIIRALRIRPCGRRLTGKRGHPRPEYDYATIVQLHAALLPWLHVTHGDNEAGD